MKIKVRITPDNITKEIQLKNNNASIEDLLLKLNIKPDTAIVMKNNIPIPIDESLENDNKLKIIRIASGG
jgi:sulfur carrier protein ThiS